MPKPPRVVILIHRHGSFSEPLYFLHEIADVWREEGIEVVVHQGPQSPVEADLAINHVDLTVVPADHLAYLRQYPVVLNRAVVDISKRMISCHLVSFGDGYEGPVIVKADRNCSGWREAELAKKGLLPATYLTVVPEYRVFDSPSHVPEGLWQRRELVIERFLPERIGEHYGLRTWVFLGDKETNSLSYATEPIIKQRGVIRREPVEEVPRKLREIREELGFDFGKFDYGIVEGEVVLYDANRTPGLGTFPKEQYMPRIRIYAKGLASFLSSHAK